MLSCFVLLYILLDDISFIIFFSHNAYISAQVKKVKLAEKKATWVQEGAKRGVLIFIKKFKGRSLYAIYMAIHPLSLPIV